jgi:hypothetical protein
LGSALSEIKKGQITLKNRCVDLSCKRQRIIIKSHKRSTSYDTEIRRKRRRDRELEPYDLLRSCLCFNTDVGGKVAIDFLLIAERCGSAAFASALNPAFRSTGASSAL